MESATATVPVTVLTGYLGAGKDDPTQPHPHP